MRVDQLRFEDLVCFNFYQGWRHVQAIYRQAFPAGVTPQRAYLLCACDPAARTSVAALIQALDLDAAGMSGLLGRLEADGLIGREVNPVDRREVLVGLSPAGVLLREQCLTALLRADESLRQAISAQDVTGLKNVVTRLDELT